MKRISYFVAQFSLLMNSLVRSAFSTLLYLLKSFGAVICCVIYIGLSLERPTALGFVFCLIVFVGSVSPDLIFVRGTPVVLLYTQLYALTRFFYASVIAAKPSLTLGATGREIGLSGMDAFDYGWVSSSLMVLVTFTLTVLIKVNSTRSEGVAAKASDSPTPPPAAGQGQEGSPRRRRSVATIQRSIYHYFEARGGLRFTCLLTIYFLGNDTSWLTLPFLVFFFLFASFKRASAKLWIFLVIYVDSYILVQYFWRFSVLDAYRQNIDLSEVGLLNYSDQQDQQDGAFAASSLITFLYIPFILHVMLIRQLRVYRLSSTTHKILKEEKGLFNDQYLVIKLALFSAPILFLVLLWYSAFSTPLNATTGGYFILLDLFPFLICCHSSGRGNVWYERMFRTVTKLTCAYAGVCLCLQAAFKLTSIKEWAEAANWYSAHFGLGQAPDVDHVVVIVSCILLEFLAPWSRMLGEEVEGFSALVPVKHLAPFAMGFSCFSAALRSVSLSGFFILCTALILLVSKENVRNR